MMANLSIINILPSPVSDIYIYQVEKYYIQIT